jgi:YhcH/YjgK/YiaL family protein
MRKGDFSLPVGDHSLEGQDAFVRVSEYNSKDPGEVFFEAHKNYADIQFVLSGEELIAVSDLSDATVKDAYDEDKDIAFYHADGRNLEAKPGRFFIFFPGEGHRPAMKAGESVPVKKMVIKVRD